MWMVGWEVEPLEGAPEYLGTSVVFESQYRGNIHSHFLPYPENNILSQENGHAHTHAHTSEPNVTDRLASSSGTLACITFSYGLTHERLIFEMQSRHPSLRMFAALL